MVELLRMLAAFYQDVLRSVGTFDNLYERSRHDTILFKNSNSSTEMRLVPVPMNKKDVSWLERPFGCKTAVLNDSKLV